MTLIPAVLLTLIFCALGSLHVYWAMGGRWGSAAVIPTKPGTLTPATMPGVVPTVIVAVGLFLMAISAWHAGPYPLWDLPVVWRIRIMAAIGLVFFLRVVGEFRYVGVFKRVKDTPFAKNDNAIYIPLCFGITLLAAWLAWNQ